MQKIYLVITVFLFFNFSQAQKQIIQNDIPEFYKITIFKWSKDSLGSEQKIIIIFDQNGRITNKVTKHSIELEVSKINEGFTKLIEQERLPKEFANNNPPPAAKIPNNNSQIINISIVTINDFNLEKEFYNNSKYVYWESHSFSEKNYTFYKYLDLTTVNILKKLLK